MENVACPGAGACGGQYTANTMSTVMEMIGPVSYTHLVIPTGDFCSRREREAADAGQPWAAVPTWFVADLNFAVFSCENISLDTAFGVQ